MNRPLAVAVLGPSEASIDEMKSAQEVGRLLAAAGAIIVCGGGRGVMEAVCRSAHDAGGTTVGLLPGRDREDGNPYLTLAIPTGLGEARNALVVQAGQVAIAVGGSLGTLSEIALALKAGKPVIGLGTWQATDPRGEDIAVQRAASPAEAVKSALQAAGRPFAPGGPWNDRE